MTTQAKMRSIDLAVDDFAKIEVRLTPGKISIISLVGVASPWRIDHRLSVKNRSTAEILSLYLN
jgi:hypothetical protein